MPAQIRSPFLNKQWIWCDYPSWDIHNTYALFRKSFELRQLPLRAPLFITADQSYQLFVNGAFVCRGPARGFQKSWPYDETDIRAHLKKGRNTIAVRAYHPGYSNFQYIAEDYAGLIVTACWGKTEINTDATWKCIRQASVVRDTMPANVQLFSQEHIDLREEPGDWAAPNFDDSSWMSPTLYPVGIAPWFNLEPRGIPMLTEREMEPARLIGSNEGVSAKGYEHVRNVVALRYLEDRSHHPSQAGFDPLAVGAIGVGKFRSYLFDFGKTVVGNLIFEVEGASGGEIIDTHYVENIDAATLTPDLIVSFAGRIAFGDRLICRPGKNVHRFFHYYGFRYLCVTVRDVTSDLALRLKLSWVGYPLERKGIFQSSDADLERIWETCAWTQQCCSLDAYVDTPWREQAQWWGDARVQAWNTFHLAGDTRLFRRGIAQIAAQTHAVGLTYGHAPTIAHHCILPDFTLIWMLTLWDYYWQTGSTEPFLTHQAVLQKALDYFRKQTDPRSGLITYDDRFWLFLDWTEIFKDGAPTIYNLWLLLALDKIALLYRIARRPREAAPLEVWARNLRLALGRLVNKHGLIRDGIDRKGKIVEETGIHGQTLALMAKLKGLDAQAIMERILLPYIRGESRPNATLSAYWITYLFTVLIEHGYQREVVDFIKMHWLPMAEHGTTWENFNPRRGDESFSHAWSAHPLYHLMQTIGGIRQSGPAWSEIVFQPLFHGTRAATTVPTPRGLIRAEWKNKGATIQVKLHLPAGTKAKVILPGVAPERVVKSRNWTVVQTKKLTSDRIKKRPSIP